MTTLGAALSNLIGRGTDIPPGDAVMTDKPADVRVIGKIIKVSPSGWGFISSKDIAFTRIFFHWTSLRQDTNKFQTIRNGMRVEFTPIEVEGKGTRAIKIKVLPDEAPTPVESTDTVATEPLPAA